MKLNMKLHHVGYTVADIHVSAKRFALLGYQAGEVLYDEGLSVELCYLTKEGSAVIELVHQLQAARWKRNCFVRAVSCLTIWVTRRKLSMRLAWS